MRLYLLPLSTRRTLLFCQKFDAVAPSSSTSAASDAATGSGAKRPLVDRVTIKAAAIWAGWEQKDRGWQRTVVNWGNNALRRIPYEEWSLKSVPPLSARRREDEARGSEKVQIVFPRTVIPESKVIHVLQTLGTERQAFHKRWMAWCFVGMPISAPCALVPIIPNLPFFYLVYRAWSHWRALAGGKHIQFLVANNLVNLAPSPALDRIYSGNPLPSASTSTKDTTLLSQAKGQELVKSLGLPELKVEIERAIWQVETASDKEGKGEQYHSKEKSVPLPAPPRKISINETQNIRGSGTAEQKG